MAASYYGQNDELELTFNFPFVFADFTADALCPGWWTRRWPRCRPGPAPVWTASNHDISRFPTRWGGGDERKARLALLMLATLPGTARPLLRRRDRDDRCRGAHGTAQGPDDRRASAASGRDAGRTPMQWDASPSAGFTAAGVTPWLPFGDNARSQRGRSADDPDRRCAWCRDLLALRRTAFGGQVAELRAAARPARRLVLPLRPARRSPPTSPTTPCPCPPRTGEVARSPPIPAPGRTPLGPWQGLVTQAPRRSAGLDSRRRSGHGSGLTETAPRSGWRRHRGCAAGVSPTLTSKPVPVCGIHRDREADSVHPSRRSRPGRSRIPTPSRRPGSLKKAVSVSSGTLTAMESR